MGRIRQLEHTADLAFEASGVSAEDALETMVGALLSTVAAGAEGIERREFEASGRDRTETVVTILGELLFSALGELWLPASCKVAELSDTLVRLSCEGEPYDPELHELEEVKAATYHDFHFAPDDRGVWTLRVVFDL